MTQTGSERLLAALKDPYHLFTRDQVAYLMSGAGRWGREVAVLDLAHAYELGRRSAHRELAELNMAAIETAIATPPFSASEIERDRARQAARDEADRTARLPREGDHPGGPVPSWDFGPECARRADTLAERLASLPRITMQSTQEWP